MPIRDFGHFTYEFGKTLTKADIKKLHEILTKFGFRISKLERGNIQFGASTIKALKAFQLSRGISATGLLDIATINAIHALNSEFEHRYFITSKTRIARLHQLLIQLGYEIGADELIKRWYDTDTKVAVRNFQSNHHPPVNGLMTPELYNAIENAALVQRFSSQNQEENAQLHALLLRAIRIVKLEDTVSSNPSTAELIQAFQNKYEFAATGIIDGTIYERIQSIAASRPAKIKKLKSPAAVNLAALPNRPLRVNMEGESVGVLQRSLAHFGYEISQKEFEAQKFGKTTRAAVVAFQKKRGIDASGHVEAKTLEALRAEVLKANPQAEKEKPTHRVRGSVRNALWQGDDVKVQVWEKTSSGETLLAERNTVESGFYNVPYHSPPE